MLQQYVEEQFRAALDTLITRLRQDRSVLAAILCGSLAHDRVWAKSDIDLVLVTIDDHKIKESDVALYADGVNVHALLVPRAQFRSAIEGALRNSFLHSLIAKGRLLYTHDDTIAQLCTQLEAIGERDTQVQLLRAGMYALGPLYKARKWLLTRGDLEYTALWILYAATPLAQIEVMSRRLLADREVIPQALQLEPSFFELVYSDLLNGRKTKANVQAALHAAEQYLADRALTLFAPVLDHLREVGEARSCTELDSHFERSMGVGSVITACEYLADRGIIGKASVGRQLTRRSNVEVQELAFFYIERR